MTDGRLLRSNGTVAHESLRGQVDANKFVTGDWMQVGATTASLRATANGLRQRELLFGQEFCVLDITDGLAFGFTRHDGYCGYVAHDVLHQPSDVTHVVKVVQSYQKLTPELKSAGPHWPLSFGSRLTVTGRENGWARIALPSGDRFVPKVHLAPIEPVASDPAKIVELFIGTPYLWGGNSAFGIDCSGLVQAALLACGIACPGDSDQQEQAVGQAVSDDAPILRGDLLFWKGHVALSCDATTLIHANANDMAVAFEPIEGTIKRIAEQGGGDVTSRKRL